MSGRDGATPHYAGRLAGALAAWGAQVTLAQSLHAPQGSADLAASSLPEVTVTAARLELLGDTISASEGVVADEELQLTPAYRPGQLLETVPGLIVTLHSGEGKANQYLMRGYNLDHGTDLAVFVDGMPINQPTHAHGQGYTDLNFLIPELADGLEFTKGPYYASVGDFGSLGSVRLSYRDSIPDQLSVGAGMFGYERVFGAGTTRAGGAELLGAAELEHYDGPFTTPDDARKANLVLRLSDAIGAGSYSLTGMYYHDTWTNTTDIPLRAITEGLVANRFGTLNPSDGGRAERASLSGEFRGECAAGQLEANAYLIYNELHLYNDFTHYLIDPVHGDQEVQFENRHVAGAAAQCSLPLVVGAARNELAGGIATRYDSLAVGRLPTEERQLLPPQTDPPSFSNSDQVYLFSGSLWAQLTTRWTATLRSVVGLRDDYQHGTDVDYLAALHALAGYTNGGTVSQSLWQPKAALIFAPSPRLELYASVGRGFHSADLRGVDQDRSSAERESPTPLLAAQVGEELGVRAQPRADLALTVALYNLHQQSETTYDPDIGTDIAGPASQRYGFEVNLTWQIREWLELYGSYSGNHARFTSAYDDGTGHLGTYIPNAPTATGELALYVTHLGRWSAGLAYRYLGSYPLSSGPCVAAAAEKDFPGVTGCATAPTLPGQVNAPGFGQLNLDVHYAGTGGWSAALGAYNLLNTRAAAAEFWYVDRLAGEVGAYPAGRADVHEHPLEPFMLRFTITKFLGDAD
jgi:outer membrane receptor protein involved in Fe transport